MKREYAEWIEDYAKRSGGFMLGKCREATEEMRVVFPELTQVRGHVFCLWGRRGHFWLTDAAGEIVDPTRSQFPVGIEYDPWTPGETVRVGRCMNCGEDIWREVDSLENVRREEVCSAQCSRELEAYYNSSDTMKILLPGAGTDAPTTEGTKP